MINYRSLIILSLVLSLFTFARVGNVVAQNPFIGNQFTADPSARVFNGKVFVFPSHDIPAPQGKNLRPDWFCMEDYHAFSSENLVNWTDHGMILSQYNVPWVDSNSYSMWAPDCVERNGKYYFYFPANTNVVDTNGRRGFGIGVAVADNPEGPYVPQKSSIKGIFGIDPNVLVDNDGQAYIYWSMGNIYVAKLKSNMLELDSEPMIIENLPVKGLKEGPWVFERNGIYYLTFPHVQNRIERIEYAIADNPMGPFKMAGVIMDESPVGCWTNHHSIIEYNNQWYMFYHHNDYSPKFDKNRSIRVDSLFFNPDGTIKKVQPTLRGVGITKANNKIHPDRYSSIANIGAKVELFDTLNAFLGWKTVLGTKGAWVKYNTVDFGNKKPGKIMVNASAINSTVLYVKLNSVDGKVISKIEIEKSDSWKVYSSGIDNFLPGINNIVIVNDSNNLVNIDWLMFE